MNAKSSLERVKGWFRRGASSVEEIAEGGQPVATPPPGAAPHDPTRETSTNAQMGVAADEPWDENR
ncbi:MAG TPA: hypothetical protein VH538_01530 [Gaiellaceae bacterium]|jgi:hypothetical protein